MPKAEPEEVQVLRSLPRVGLGEAAEGLDAVKGFLERFGYLEARPGPAAAATPPEQETLDDAMSVALARYQAMQGLPASGIFDEDTREMMARSRCLLPGARAPTTCRSPSRLRPSI